MENATISNIEYLLIFLNGMVGLAIATISENYNPTERWKKKLKKGILLILGLCLLGIPIWQKSIGDKASEENKEKEEARADKRISNAKDHFDTLHLLTMQGFGDAIGKYGLYYDSTKRELKKISEAQMLKSDPVLQFCRDERVRFAEFKDGKDFFDINLCSMGAGSSGINVKIHYAIGDSITVQPELHHGIVRVSNEPLSENEKVSPRIYLTGYYPKYNALFVWAEGYYWNSTGTTKFPINQVAVYFFKINRAYKIDPEARDKVISYFKK